MKLIRTVLFIMLVQAAFAQRPMPGSVQGTIRSSESSQPVGGGIVELRDLNQNESPRPVLSNDKGDFVFSSVAPGRYRIVVTRSGFASRQGPLVLVSPGQKVSIAPLTLFPGATVSGRINYANGEPMPLVSVSMVKAAYADDGHPTVSEVATQITNDRGEYRFFWLPPGTFYLKAENARQNMQTTVLMNPNGNGLRSAAGMFSSSRSLPQITTDPGLNEDQTYIERYYPGISDWERATPLELSPGTELRNINITMIPETLLRVRGVAFSQTTQQPAQGTVVASMRSIDTSNGDTGFFSQYLQFNQGGGAFEFRGVFSGRYEIRASADGLAGRITTDVRVIDADIRVPLLPPVTITGKVKVEGVSDVSSIRIGITGNLASVAANGDFKISNVAVASYAVAVRFPPTMPEAYVQSIQFQNSDITNSPLIVDGEPTSPIEVIVNPAGGSIEGTAANSRREVVPGATVLLIPDQTGTIRPELYRTSASDSSGKFEFHALPPGNYFIYAWADIEKNSWFAPTFMRDFESYRERVQIAAGQKLQLTVTTASAN